VSGLTGLQRLHNIPCTRCVFFTGDYRLKCTVRPCQALSEDAIHCLDFEQMMGNQNRSKIRYKYRIENRLTSFFIVGGSRRWQSSESEGVSRNC